MQRDCRIVFVDPYPVRLCIDLQSVRLTHLYGASEPDIAANAGLKRGPTHGVINVAVQRPDGSAVDAILKGEVRSLIGQPVALDFNRSGRLPEPVTWHTTLLAEVGPNAEGPLPWVERDYTPVSSAKEWEAGRCELLVKVYPHGAATGWLHRQALL